MIEEPRRVEQEMADEKASRSIAFPHYIMRRNWSVHVAPSTVIGQLREEGFVGEPSWDDMARWVASNHGLLARSAEDKIVDGGARGDDIWVHRHDFFGR